MWTPEQLTAGKRRKGCRHTPPLHVAADERLPIPKSGKRRCETWTPADHYRVRAGWRKSLPGESETEGAPEQAAHQGFTKRSELSAEMANVPTRGRFDGHRIRPKESLQAIQNKLLYQAIPYSKFIHKWYFYTGAVFLFRKTSIWPTKIS